MPRACGHLPADVDTDHRDPTMKKIVLLRHGESTWNQEDRFTGWTDVDLTARGEGEARKAGRWLADAGILPDVAHTSLQTRAIRTLLLALEELGRLWIPLHKSWRLNERHYGALQGLNKADTRQRYGEEQFMLWRRSFDVPPPPLGPDDERHPRFDARYRELPTAGRAPAARWASASARGPATSRDRRRLSKASTSTSSASRASSASSRSRGSGSNRTLWAAGSYPCTSSSNGGGSSRPASSP